MSAIRKYPKHLDATERKIIDKLISTILDAGHKISIYDSAGSFSISKSRDIAAISETIAETDETNILIRDDNNDQVGWIMLIHGNGTDVISDMTDNPTTLALAKPAEDLAETLEY
jgi:hypothetical protein